jgi:hypothetical protein
VRGETLQIKKEADNLLWLLLLDFFRSPRGVTFASAQK